MEVYVCDIGSVPDTGVRQFEVDGKAVLLWKNGESLCAVNGVCPHRGAQLGLGSVEDGVITCPWHDWSFDLATGKGITNPMSCLEKYEVTLNEGLVYIRLG